MDFLTRNQGFHKIKIYAKLPIKLSIFLFDLVYTTVIQ